MGEHDAGPDQVLFRVDLDGNAPAVAVMGEAARERIGALGLDMGRHLAPADCRGLAPGLYLWAGTVDPPGVGRRVAVWRGSIRPARREDWRRFGVALPPARPRPTGRDAAEEAFVAACVVLGAAGGIFAALAWASSRFGDLPVAHAWPWLLLDSFAGAVVGCCAGLGFAVVALWAARKAREGRRDDAG
jgi:hypothetical protein